MKFCLAVLLTCVAGNSYFLASLCESSQIAGLEGGQAAGKCKNPCKVTSTKNNGECLHITSSNTEKCSKISCILNVDNNVGCDTQASGGVECEFENGTPTTQETFDVPCGTAPGYVEGPYAEIVLQAAGDCLAEHKADFRCLHACGGSMGYGVITRSGPVCKGGVGTRP